MYDPAEQIPLFRRQFNAEPDIVVRAPGRVEIIGGHTDYNDGFVLPMAIDRQCVILARRRTDMCVRLFSDLFGEMVEFELSADVEPVKGQWANYAKGVAALLMKAGTKLIGLDMLVTCDVPSGGGLSSSAALEVGYAKTFLASVDEDFEPVRLALLAQQAEHEYAGAPCGIMDQFICVLGKADHALLLDCRSQGYEHVHMPLEHAGILIADTRVKHDLGSSEYPVRRAQCHKAAEIIGGYESQVKALRDVDDAMLEKYADKLDEVQLKRARHIVGEDKRVLEAAEGFRLGDLPAAGDAMNRSHNSLRDDYEVSCQELDFMVDKARLCDGVYGARMSGGGFGGCIVALIDRSAADDVASALLDAYKKEYSQTAGIFVTQATEGAEVIKS